MESVLEQRLREAGSPSASGEGLVRVIDLVGVPDFGTLVESEALRYEDLIELRESREGSTFREWLKDLDPSNPRQVERAVVEDLLTVSRVQGLGGRVLRIAATVRLGLTNPVVGIIASVTDSIVVDKLFRGWCPRVFVERLR